MLALLRSRYENATPISVGCSVQTYKEGFFQDCIFDTHFPRFEALAYVLPHFDALTHMVIRHFDALS